jgi:hypothetical protein
MHNRPINRHGKTLGVGGRGAQSIEFARYGLLGHDAAYCGTDLPTFRSNLLVSSSLVDIYRQLEPRSVSCIRCHEDGDCTV